MPTSLQRVKQINSVEKNKPITFGEALNLICGTFSEQFLHETDAESLYEKVKRLPFDESLKQASEWGMIPPAAACRQDFDGTVTCKELLHMYVAAMGFTASASEQGPLPESCFNILTERGLLEGVKIRSTNLPAETDDALKIAANCLPARNTVFAVPASMIEGELFNNNVFYSGENFTLAVRFERAVGEFGKVTVNYRIYDFDNCETERGRLDPEVVGKGITVYFEPSDRTVGWFRVEFDLYENGKQLPIIYTANMRDSAGFPSADDGGFISYALVPKGTVIDKDSPFGYDCGLTTSPVLTPSQMIRVASMVGVSWLRDRIPYIFPHLFRERGVSDYTKLKAVADEVASKGLSLLTAFHTLPLWMTDSDPRSAGKKMSYNLFDIYNLAKETGENMKDSYSALEIWNEAEIGFFGGCPSDHLAAITKAYSLGYKKSGSKTKMMLNPFGRNPMRGRFG